jgi:hypothetical protein
MVGHFSTPLGARVSTARALVWVASALLAGCIGFALGVEAALAACAAGFTS